MFELDVKLNDIKINHDVAITLNNIVTLLEEWYAENEIRNYQRHIYILKDKENSYNMKMKELEFEKHNIKKEVIRIKKGAYDIREKMCIDVCEVLYKSRHHIRLESKVSELEKDNKFKKEQVSILENDFIETQENISILENAIDSTKVKVFFDRMKNEDISSNNDSILIKNDDLYYNDSNSPDTDKIDVIKERHTLLTDFEDDIILLQTFSYLNTNEVLNAAQCNKFVFKRVDTLFEIESKVALEEWSINKSLSNSLETNSNNKNRHSNSTRKKIDDDIISTVAPSNLVSSALEAFGTSLLPDITNSHTFGTISIKTYDNYTNSNSIELLTQEMADILAKKLTAIELKAIIAISDRLKKKSVTADQLGIEKEDIRARLKSAEEVRDFLVDKLKNAELALKAYMYEAASLKKQQSADNEVIIFLDLKEQELNTRNAILAKKCERLQASYDLLSRSNTQNEQVLHIQLEKYKSKCEHIEASYKSEKKILVKEVKSLRTQFETVSHERNLYKQQIISLQKTLYIGGDSRDINIDMQPKKR